MNCKRAFFFILALWPFIISAQQTNPVFPSNKAVTGDTLVSFVWNPVPGSSVTYQLQCSADSLFTTLLYDLSPLSSTSIHLSFIPGNKYWWRVRHAVGGNPQGWSNPYSFSVFSPELLPGIIIWLETDTGLTLSGSNAQNWQSRTGSYSMSQTDPAKRPLVTDTALIRKPALSFDGSNDFLQGPFINKTSLSIVLLHNPLKKNSTTLFSQARYAFSGFNWFINNTPRPSLKCIETTSYLGYEFNGKVFPFNIPSDRMSIDGISLNATGHTLYTGLNDTSSSQSIQFLDNPLLTFSRLGAMGNNSDYYKGNIYGLVVTDTIISKSNYEKLYNYFLWKYQPPVNLGADIQMGYSLCTVILQPTHHYKSYNWSTGDTTHSLTVNNAGTYWVQVTDFFGRTTSDTVVVTGQKPQVSLNDTTICLGDTIILNPGLTGSYSYIWNSDTLLNQPVLPVASQGKQTVSIYDTLGCILKDSANIIVDQYSLFASLGPDRTACIGETIGLITGAGQTVNYQWSTGINDTFPAVFVSGPGTYSVTSTNFRGCKAYKQVNITLKGIQPTALFSVTSPKICLGDTFVFTDQSFSGPSDPLSGWLWNMGDYNTYTSPGPVSHIYNLPGTYAVSLKVTTDSGCTNTFTDTIVVLPLPSVAITLNKACTGTPAVFSYNSSAGPMPVEYLWTFHSSSPIPHYDTAAKPAFTWMSQGNYNVDLKITDSLGCSNSASFPIVVYLSPVTYISSDQNPVCAGATVTFTDTGYAHPQYPNQYWFWYFDDGTPLTPSFINNISHPFPDPGTYQISLVAGSLITGCKDSTNLLLQVNNNPVAKLGNNNLCSGQVHLLSDLSTVTADSIVSWLWTLQGQGVFTDKNPAVLYSDTGVYNVSLVVKSGAGCSDTTQGILMVNITPTALFTTSPIYGLPPLKVDFMNYSQNGTQYDWQFGDGNSSVLFEPSYTYTQSGVYEVVLVVTADNGCFSTHSSKIYTLQPLVDLELLQVQGIKTENRIKPVVEFRNNSPLEIHQVEIEAWLSGGSSIVERWIAQDLNDRLLPGYTKRLEFSSSFLTRDDIPNVGNVICARAIIPEFPIDSEPGNNEQCAALTKDFTIKDPWPNPSKSNVNIDLIIDQPGNCEMEVFTAQGQSLGVVFNDYLDEGFNRIELSLSTSMRSGIYFIKIRYRDNFYIKRIILQERP